MEWCGVCGRALDADGLCPVCDRCGVCGWPMGLDGACMNAACGGEGADFRVVVVVDVARVAKSTVS